MFTAVELKNWMSYKQFVPFNLRMRYGSTYVVPHHDAALVTRNWLEVGTDLGNDHIPGSVFRCAILHITQIENLQMA